MASISQAAAGRSCRQASPRRLGTAPAIGLRRGDGFFNQPWAIAMAPSNFGSFSNDLSCLEKSGWNARTT